MVKMEDLCGADYRVIRWWICMVKMEYLCGVQIIQLSGGGSVQVQVHDLFSSQNNRQIAQLYNKAAIFSPLTHHLDITCMLFLPTMGVFETDG